MVGVFIFNFNVYLDEIKLINTATQLDKGKLIVNLSKVGKEYSVKFDFMATSFEDPQRNILHMQAKGISGGREGYRIPMINACATPHSGSIEITSAVNQRLNYYNNNTIKFEREEWNTIEVSQEKIGMEYNYMIFINGLRVHCIINKQPREYHDVMVFASSPYSEGQEGFIRNLIIHGGKGIIFIHFYCFC